MMTERTLTKAEIEANVQKTIAETENTLAAAANNAAQAEWYKAQASLKKHEVNIAKIQQAKIAREETFALATDLLQRPTRGQLASATNPCVVFARYHPHALGVEPHLAGLRDHDLPQLSWWRHRGRVCVD